MAKQKSRFPSYGLVRGASHEHGGVAGMVAGEQPVELEGGEWIIPKEAVPDYLPVLKQITNEGRAMQQMDNGNTAMDALIASASMESGITQPKSPMYQEGGSVSDKSWLEKVLTDERGLFRGEPSKDVYRASAVDWKTGTTRKLGGAPYQISVPEAVAFTKEVGSPDFKGEKTRFHGVIGMINDMMLKRGLEKEAVNLRRELNPYSHPYEEQVSVKTPRGSSEYDQGYGLKVVLPHQETERLVSTPGEEYPVAVHDYLKKTRSSAPLVAAEELIKKRQSQPSNIVELLGGLLKGKEQKQGGPVYNYQEGGVVPDKTRIGMSEYIPELSYDLPTFDGKTKQPQYSMSNMPMSQKELLDIAMGMATPGSAIGSIGKRASKIATRRDLFGRFYKDPISGLSKKGMLKLVKDAVPENTMDAYGEPLSYFKNMETDDLADALRSAYGLARNPKHYGEELAGKGVAAYFTDMGREGVKQALDDIKHLKVKEQGGPIKQYGQGGQIQPRKQQEIRNPQVYGPPAPANMDSVLKQIMIRDVNQSINPFTGDTINAVLDSLKHKQKLKKSLLPRTGRKNMYSGGPVMYQQGGPVMYANGGQLGAGQRLERRGPENMGEVTDIPQLGSISRPEFEAAMEYGGPPQASDSLMAAAGQDRRVKPVDTYIVKDGVMSTEEAEVNEIPKLSTAYLAAFGFATPLSKRQQALLYRKGIAPQTLNPQVKGLINRALVQRLANEDD